MRGRRPKPTSIRRKEGNRGKRPFNRNEPVPPDGMPSCPEHLSIVAAAEWERVAKTLHEMGVLTTIDRAALAAYCQAYGRWVEAEEKLAETPALFKTPSGYVQQSPWLGIANKQLELMGRYMTELGMTPASRSRVDAGRMELPQTHTFVTVYEEKPTATEALLEKLDGASNGPEAGARGMRLPARRGPTPRGDLPTCPDHLVPAAAEEWHRVVGVLDDMGILTHADRGALAAYCQVYGRWVEAEEMLRKTPMLFKTPSGYVQQSPWLGIIHKQLELMGRYMVELGLTPAARSRVAADVAPAQDILRIERVILPYPPGTESEVIHRGPMDADTWLARHGGSD